MLEVAEGGGLRRVRIPPGGLLAIALSALATIAAVTAAGAGAASAAGRYRCTSQTRCVTLGVALPQRGRLDGQGSEKPRGWEVFQDRVPNRRVGAPFSGFIVRWRVIGCGTFRLRVVRYLLPGDPQSARTVGTGPTVTVPPGPVDRRSGFHVNCEGKLVFPSHGPFYYVYRIHAFNAHVQIARGERVAIDLLPRGGYPDGGVMATNQVEGAVAYQSPLPPPNGNSGGWTEADFSEYEFNADVVH